LGNVIFSESRRLVATHCTLIKAGRRMQWEDRVRQEITNSTFYNSHRNWTTRITTRQLIATDNSHRRSNLHCLSNSHHNLSTCVAIRRIEKSHYNSKSILLSPGNKAPQLQLHNDGSLSYVATFMPLSCDSLWKNPI
jgi:hypothetical protein